MGMFTPKQLYAAIRSAETDMLDTKKWGHNRWRRTSDNTVKNGSTAFGPVQLTGNRLKGQKFKDKDLQNYADRFMSQSELFNIHGNEKAMKGYDPRLGYSDVNNPEAGVGMLTSKKDKQDYVRLTQKMMDNTYNRQKGDIDNFIIDWRHGQNYINKHGKTGIDKDYLNKVKAYLKANP
mgnify:FL=1|jgi:hypothetical protein